MSSRAERASTPANAAGRDCVDTSACPSSDGCLGGGGLGGGLGGRLGGGRGGGRGGGGGGGEGPTCCQSRSTQPEEENCMQWTPRSWIAEAEQSAPFGASTSGDASLWHVGHSGEQHTHAPAALSGRPSPHHAGGAGGGGRGDGGGDGSADGGDGGSGGGGSVGILDGGGGDGRARTLLATSVERMNWRASKRGVLNLLQSRVISPSIFASPSSESQIVGTPLLTRYPAAHATKAASCGLSSQPQPIEAITGVPDRQQEGRPLSLAWVAGVRQDCTHRSAVGWRPTAARRRPPSRQGSALNQSTCGGPRRVRGL